MSASKQVFWLRGLSTGFALPLDGSGMMKRSSLVTAALPRGLFTRFPILPGRGAGHLLALSHTTSCVLIQRTVQYLGVPRCRSQAERTWVYDRFARRMGRYRPSIPVHHCHGCSCTGAHSPGGSGKHPVDVQTHLRGRAWKLDL